MREKEYARGPWVYEEGDFNCPDDHCSEQLGSIISEDEWRVAAIELIDHPTSLANAHLIAASPEILEGLEETLALFEMKLTENDAIDRHHIKEMQKIIDKAYGEDK